MESEWRWSEGMCEECEFGAGDQPIFTEMYCVLGVLML